VLIAYILYILIRIIYLIAAWMDAGHNDSSAPPAIIILA
jgi:hypothetical protein